MTSFEERCEREDEEDRLALARRDAIRKWLAEEAPKPAYVYRNGKLVHCAPEDIR